MSMTVTFLHPDFHARSIETRYGQQQAVRAIETQHPFEDSVLYSPEATASKSLERIESDLVLVLTDPLAVAAPNLVGSLIGIGGRARDLTAVVPATNLTENGAQRRDLPSSFLTLGQFERHFEVPGFRNTLSEWDGADPGLFLAPVAKFRQAESTLREVLVGKQVAVAEDTFLFRYAPQQRMPRLDLLEMIPTDVTTILEIGCGEGMLGAQIRSRQDVRVVGIEIDRKAAEQARSRLDEVLAQDALTAVPALDETFEWIVGGDVLEHVEDPWLFLRELKRVAVPGGRLLLSIPNVSAWAIVGELLRGRFDYSYAGHLSAGHLRFFTRRTIEETIAMGGWELESIRPMPDFAPEAGDELFEKLDQSGLPYSREDLSTPGWYVLARNT